MGVVVLVWGSALLSVLLMLGTMWSWSSDVLAMERKGYYSGMVLWSLVSSFHLAKLVRDRGDPIKRKELQNQIPYQLLIVGSSALSAAALVVGTFLMPLALQHRLFLLVGTGFTISAAFFLAKQVRDRQEVAILRQLAAGEQHKDGDSTVVTAGAGDGASGP